MLRLSRRTFSHLPIKQALGLSMKSHFRCLSSEENKFNKFIGYECSGAIEVEAEMQYLDKSVRSGCRLVVGRTEAHCPDIYEFLFDNAYDSDEYNLADFILGHVLEHDSNNPKNTQNLDIWVNEIKSINNILSKRNKFLDFITFQCPLKDEKSIDVPEIVESYQYLNENCQKLTGQNKTLQNKITKIGLNLSTKLLIKQQKDIKNLLNDLDQLKTNNNIDIITLAVNPRTLENSYLVSNWAREKGIKIIGTELLRTHEEKSGFLTSGFLPISVHRAVEGSSSGKETQGLKIIGDLNLEDSLAVSNLQAVKDFKNALERCLYLEKQYLEKFPKPVIDPENDKSFVDPKDFFVAHTLAGNQRRIRSPEHWFLIYNKQFEPHFLEALQRLEKASKKQNEWKSLYYPHAKYLISSFKGFLQANMIKLTRDVHEIISEENGKVDGETFSKDISEFVANLGTDHITLTSSHVDINSWKIEKSEKSIEIDKFKEKMILCDRILKVFDSYYEGST